MIIPVGGYDLPEVPRTRRFSLFCSVLVGSKLGSSGLGVTVDAVKGEGIVAMLDVISELADEAR